MPCAADALLCADAAAAADAPRCHASMAAYAAIIMPRRAMAAMPLRCHAADIALPPRPRFVAPVIKAPCRLRRHTLMMPRDADDR